MLGRIYSWRLCSCNGSLALCAAKMLAFEANGEGRFTTTFMGARHNTGEGKLYSAPNNSVQELRLDDTLNSLRSETSAICLPAIFSIFLVVFVVMETTRHSLVIGQLSKRCLT